MPPPSIVAFTVAPTSGGLPYTFNATFADQESFIPSRYGLELRQHTNTNSCPAPGDQGTLLVGAAAELLNSGEYIQTISTVPAGSCRTYNLIIRDLRTGAMLSMMSTNVDNV